MKKFRLSVFAFLTTFLFLALFNLDSTQAASSYTPKACPDAKVVVHYKKLDNNYAGVGVVTWGNGANGSVMSIAKSGIDDFGAVVEICVDRSSDAGNTGGFSPLHSGLEGGVDKAEWLGSDFRDAGDINYDRTQLMNRTVNELHIYYVSGMDTLLSYTPKTCTTGRKVVIHYQKSDGVYDGVGAVTWGNGTNGSNQAINKSGIDDFGAVIELCIGADVTDKNGGFVPIKTGLPANGNDLADWLSDSSYRDSGDINYDRTSLVNGSTKELHLYYVSGMTQVLYENPMLKNEFVQFDPIKNIGTYANTTTELKVAFLFPTDVTALQTNLVLEDSEGNAIAFTTIVADDEENGIAKNFTITVPELNKNAEYTLIFKGEVTNTLDLDHYKPNINYTNKVKMNAALYDETTDTFLIEKGTTFNLEQYIRLNVVDDRDGSLLDQLSITGTPDTSVLGEYTLKISATDSWNNVSEREFKFRVIEKTVTQNPTDPVQTTEPVQVDPVLEESSFFEEYGVILGIVFGIVVLSSLGVIIIKRK